MPDESVLLEHTAAGGRFTAAVESVPGWLALGWREVTVTPAVPETPTVEETTNA